MLELYLQHWISISTATTRIHHNDLKHLERCVFNLVTFWCRTVIRHSDIFSWRFYGFYVIKSLIALHVHVILLNLPCHNLIFIFRLSAYWFFKKNKTVMKQKRSTEGCSKYKSPETRQVQERLVSTLEHMQVPRWDRTRCPEENASSVGMPHEV